MMSIKCIPDLLHFLHKEGSKFFCQFLVTGGGGRGLGYLLPVIVLMRLNSFLVYLPTSMICKESVCVFYSSYHGNVSFSFNSQSCPLMFSSVSPPDFLPDPDSLLLQFQLICEPWNSGLNW